ncbi:hypothetical protein L198_00880 [Cryptococcus wingfieldii CBS 7118]|uniref:FAD/NAD(P)-binding domain-containing protein n=1 Tax=Cryptococcus wingfieldii CBS 7118 TaxID=1295528 RepID=A0A1E3K2R1_9TREE|nr:hypothetical protein L198_00880 [Cryptococcus wingfieldii CBS 7118]ODO07301.1 hypothetical protein L198_00880 [Cryptococcus wingfieldii CBS 7118]
MSQLQNIVIIGASNAGHNLANALQSTHPKSHRILLIDALEYSVWPLAALRAAVVPGWEDKITAPLRDTTVFAAGSQHKVIAPNRVVELREQSVVLEYPFESSVEVPFFRCVIATGASQPSPMRPPSSTTEDEFKQSLRKSQQQLAQSKKVVIIGGGTVGVEMAGEIRAVHPEIEITIIHPNKALLAPEPLPKTANDSTKSWTNPPTAPKLSKNLQTVLEGMNVKLILGDRAVIPEAGSVTDFAQWDGTAGPQSQVKKLSLQSGEQVEADYVFVSVGNKPNTQLVESVDQDAITSGLVAVDDYLKVASTTDSSPLSKNSNYYALGDVSAAPGPKTAYFAAEMAKVLAQSIVNEVNGKSPTQYNPGTFSVFFVPVGPNDGAGSLTLPYIGTCVVGGGMVKMAKGKDLLVGMSWKPLWQGSEKVA